MALVCLAIITLSACKEEENALLNTYDGKLAAIDAGTTRITEDQVRPYTLLLSRLEAKCGDTQNGIADTATRAKTVFEDRNEI